MDAIAGALVALRTSMSHELTDAEFAFIGSTTRQVIMGAAGDFLGVIERAAQAITDVAAGMSTVATNYETAEASALASAQKLYQDSLPPAAPPPTPPTPPTFEQSLTPPPVSSDPPYLPKTGPPRFQQPVVPQPGPVVPVDLGGDGIVAPPQTVGAQP